MKTAFLVFCLLLATVLSFKLNNLAENELDLDIEKGPASLKARGFRVQMEKELPSCDYLEERIEELQDASNTRQLSRTENLDLIGALFWYPKIC